MSYSAKKQQKIKKQFLSWEKEKEYLNLKQDIQHERYKIKNKYKKQKKSLTTTKFLMLFLFISCSIIELFTLYITFKVVNMGLEVDFTPLQMLITAVVAEVIGFAVYSLKSLKENTKGGIIYQTAMKQQQQKENILLDDEQEEVKG